MTDPKFHLTGVRLRFNPKIENDILITAGEITDFGGVVKLKGFTKETAIVENCVIEFDNTLEKGSIILEPIESEEENDAKTE